MSVSAPDPDSYPTVQNARVAILTSSWHKSLVDSMKKHCEDVLLRKGVVHVETFELPGTLELPIGVQLIADRTYFDAYVCLSVVEKGDTAHFDMIVHSTTRALLNLSVELHIPIINEIIAVYDIADAQTRASDDEFNKGIEAAGAALTMIDFARKLS